MKVYLRYRYWTF